MHERPICKTENYTTLRRNMRGKPQDTGLWQEFLGYDTKSTCITGKQIHWVVSGLKPVCQGHEQNHGKGLWSGRKYLQVMHLISS